MTTDHSPTAKLTAAGLVAHPAKFSDPILEHVAKALPEYRDLIPRWAADPDTDELLLLDSMAGTGKVHLLADQFGLPFTTMGIELEREWADQHPRTMVGDGTNMTHLATGAIDVVFASPTYGNRMADHHDAKDDSVRHTYTHYLGRPLSPGSSAAMPWGRVYREFHERWLREQVRVLAGGSLLILNVKNHLETVKGTEVEHHVVEFFVNTAMLIGCTVEAIDRVNVPGLGHGANHGTRVPTEKVAWFRTPTTNQQAML